VIAERLTGQLLAGPPARDPVAVARRLLAVQGQDARGVRLAIRARTEPGRLTVADVDAALTVDRSLLISWLCRGTLQLVCREDYGWLHALTTPPLRVANARRLAQEGVPPDGAERAVRVVGRALADDGPLTRAQLGERVAAAGVRTEGQALVHILFQATLEGLTVRGPVIGKQHAYVLVRDWLGPQPALPDRDTMLAELARRYLAGHWPASDRDLARWAGLPLRDARVGLRAIAPELDEGDDGLVALRAAPPAADELPPPRLLGSFDPLLIGWKSRAFVTGEDDPKLIAGGMFLPSALVRGRAVASWRFEGAEVALTPFAGPLRPGVLRALQADAVDVRRYLGLP
jgi:hypothetical protein